MNVVFLIVVYSTVPSQTKTLRSLTALNFASSGITPRICVWDNSIYGFDDEEFISSHAIQRFHCGENTSLAKVYNKVIKELSDYDFLVILDDDTVITDDYLAGIKSAHAEAADIGIPVIKLNGKIISPGILAGVHGKSIDNINPGLTQIGNFTAMMSGTCISKQVISSGLRFDERLSFYGVDTRFFRDCSKANYSLFIMPVDVEHDSALRNVNIDDKSRLIRLNNLMSSWFLVFDDMPRYRFRIFWYSLYFVFKQVVKYRKIRYLSLLSQLKGSLQ
ncbi:glycosyltransferase family protein [Pseudaeromonas pectinilytica]